MSKDKQSKVKWHFRSKDGLNVFAHAFPSENPP